MPAYRASLPAYLPLSFGFPHMLDGKRYTSWSGARPYGHSAQAGEIVTWASIFSIERSVS